MTPPRRYKAISPVTDFNVSQRIRVQLLEDGHTELAIASITQPIRDLEEDLGHLQQRVKALEIEKAEWQTASGVHRIITARIGEATVDWAKWAVRGSLAAVGVALLGFIGRLAWKGLHGT